MNWPGNEVEGGIFENVLSMGECREKCKSLADPDNGIEVPFFTWRSSKAPGGHHYCNCKTPEAGSGAHKEIGVFTGRTECCPLKKQLGWGDIVHGYAQCKNGDCKDALRRGSNPGLCDSAPAVMAKHCPYFEKHGQAEPQPYHRCDNGQCIHYYGWCDGFQHCQDGSDETETSCGQCPIKGHFTCVESGKKWSGTCVKPSDVCNGFDHCVGDHGRGSDENPIDPENWENC